MTKRFTCCTTICGSSQLNDSEKRGDNSGGEIRRNIYLRNDTTCKTRIMEQDALSKIFTNILNKFVTLHGHGRFISEHVVYHISRFLSSTKLSILTKMAGNQLFQLMNQSTSPSPHYLPQCPSNLQYFTSFLNI